MEMEKTFESIPRQIQFKRTNKCRFKRVLILHLAHPSSYFLEAHPISVVPARPQRAITFCNLSMERTNCSSCFSVPDDVSRDSKLCVLSRVVVPWAVPIHTTSTAEGSFPLPWRQIGEGWLVVCVVIWKRVVVGGWKRGVATSIEAIDKLLQISRCVFVPDKVILI